MKKTNLIPPSRQRRLNIRLSQPEWEKVHDYCDRTTCRSISEYARKLLLHDPVKVHYRNQSMDDLEEQLNRLLPQLEQFGDNFDQAVQQLSIIATDPAIKALLPGLNKSQEGFCRTAEAIKDLLTQYAALCAQRS